MKILQINSVCGIRSTGRIAVDLAREYEMQGHECKIAYGRENVPEKYQKYAVRIGSELGVRINGIKARCFDTEGFHAKKATKVFLKWASEYNPDILWLHNLHGYYINVEMLFKWIKSRESMTVKWLLHDCWAFTGHCAYFTAANCEQWKIYCSHCIQRYTYPSSLFKDNSRNNYSRKRSAFCGVKNMLIITPSQWLADLVKESFLHEYEVEVKYNKIDKNVFKPTPSDFRKKYGLENRKIILGVASAWSRNKGLYDFIRLPKMLNDTYAVVLVGLTKKQRKKISDSVICIPQNNNTNELAKIYSAADLFLNLTYQDNYPTVNLEAQACGTPCLTYDTGGSVESVPEENVVRQGDLEAIVEWIKNAEI